jgi:hypothetical protein
VALSVAPHYVAELGRRLVWFSSATVVPSPAIRVKKKRKRRRENKKKMRK